MKKVLCIFLWLQCAFLGFGCQKATSQTTEVSAPVKVEQSQKTLLETKPNRKYGLSLVFYRSTRDATPSVRMEIRNDKTGQETELYILAEDYSPENTPNFWSPNEEYLVLADYDFTVYKSVELLKFFENDDFSLNSFLMNAKSVDRIEILTDKPDAPFVHTFVKWENNDSFSFMINRKSEKVGEFRYDLAKRKLYRRVKKSDIPSPEEKQKNAALSALSGKNKKGVIRPASIKNESAAPK